MRQLYVHVANGCQVVSIQVYSEVSRPWLKERTKFTQNAPLFTRTTVNLKWTKFLCSFAAWVRIETTGSFASESHQRANHVTCFENTKTYKLIFKGVWAIWAFSLQSPPWLLKFPCDSFSLKDSGIKWPPLSRFYCTALDRRRTRPNPVLTLFWQPQKCSQGAASIACQCCLGGIRLELPEASDPS